MNQGSGRRGPAAGFTLVEVLVMAALLAFALLAVAVLIAFGMKHNARGRDETVMAGLVQAQMEKLRTEGTSDLYDSICDGTALSTFGPSDTWHCLSDPATAERDNWPKVSESDGCWDTGVLEGDDLEEGQYRWNYCVYEVVFGNCRPPSSGSIPTDCGPDPVGMRVEADKIVVEVCRAKEFDPDSKYGRKAHCVKAEMLR